MGAAVAAAGGVRALLTTLQWTDSAFPSGLYTLSHGLEGLAQQGAATKDSLDDVVSGLLRHSIGPSDATATCLAWRAAEAGDLDLLIRIDDELSATRPSAGMRRGSHRAGRQTLTMAGELGVDGRIIGAFRDVVLDGRAPGNQAVAIAVVKQQLEVGIEHVAAAELAGFVNGIAGAAIRLRLADHVSAQRLVSAMALVIVEVLADALSRTIDELGPSTPALDIASAAHETAPARLFLN
ncbi:urease accessory protein [Corynebacterium xerosis]|uniref:Urease accessory protein UreF n=1 Tax=Corynebacterium xerosis TaxID=1725 RepID=A0A2N6T0M4_9CORY|nr:urease accessory UreF family protein [Corynebacterium xerosis]PMC62877.1 urease accessory protein [Corynebacterium xerosis]QGS33608.1 urease accessory protein [Corynebacterium xerosis]